MGGVCLFPAQTDAQSWPRSQTGRRITSFKIPTGTSLFVIPVILFVKPFDDSGQLLMFLWNICISIACYFDLAIYSGYIIQTKHDGLAYKGSQSNIYNCVS